VFSLAIRSFVVCAAGVAALLTHCVASPALSAQTLVTTPSLPAAEEFVHGIDYGSG
jgi:hypothetical protein